MLTSYPTSRSAKYAGMLSYQRIKGLVHSRVCEASAGIEFGMPAFTVNGATNDNGCTSDETTGLIIGIALRDHGQGMTYNNSFVPSSAVDSRYVQKSCVSIIDKDAVVINVATTGNFGDIVYYDTSSNTYKVVAIASLTATMIPVGRLLETLTAAGLADVWVDTNLVVEGDYTPDEDTDWDTPPTTVAGGLDELASRVTVNEAGIATNVADIATNTAGIATNVTDIATNAASIASLVDDHVRAVCTGLAAQTDEAEVSAALDGDGVKKFVPTDIIIKVTDVEGSVNADATINVGTTTDGAELLSAQALTGLTAVGKVRRIPLSEATSDILSDATLYANVESNETTATTLELSVFVLGRQV
jgi:hypothetical protein